jgi:hypothetical protein
MNVVKLSRSSNGLPRGGTEETGPSSAAALSNINLYQEIPSMEVSLDDFEEYALDRLKVSSISSSSSSSSETSRYAYIINLILLCSTVFCTSMCLVLSTISLFSVSITHYLISQTHTLSRSHSIFYTLYTKNAGTKKD